MDDAERADSALRAPQPVGERLRTAREAMGLSLAEVGARTRVPLRHLEAIEAGAYGQLPSPTYAVGFVRAYARAVGGDEVALARDVRGEAAAAGRATPQYQPYEIADPRRVPSRTLVIVTAGLGLAIVCLAILWFASGLGRVGDDAPVAGAVPSVAVAVPAVQPSAPPAAPQVRLTASDEVWMRVYDAADQTLYLGTMKPGETFDVPATADNPMINVGRPDKLAITLNGSAIAPLGDGRRAIKDVPIGGAALAARASGVPAAAPTAAAAPAAAVPPAFSRPAAPPRRSAPAARRGVDDETRRANERSPVPRPTATVRPSGARPS